MIIELLKALKEFIELNNSFVEVVEIIGDDPNDFPDFDKYAVILTPKSRQRIPTAKSYKQRSFIIDVLCVVKNFHFQTALIGEDTITPGVIKMSELIEESLERFGNQNTDKYCVLQDELNGDIEFQTKKMGDRDDFFYVVSIPWKVKLYPEVTL